MVWVLLGFLLEAGGSGSGRVRCGVPVVRPLAGNNSGTPRGVNGPTTGLLDWSDPRGRKARCKLLIGVFGIVPHSYRYTAIGPLLGGRSFMARRLTRRATIRKPRIAKANRIINATTVHPRHRHGREIRPTSGVLRPAQSPSRTRGSHRSVTRERSPRPSMWKWGLRAWRR